jgi:hypothetical protein
MASRYASSTICATSSSIRRRVDSASGIGMPPAWLMSWPTLGENPRIAVRMSCLSAARMNAR